MEEDLLYNKDCLFIFGSGNYVSWVTFTSLQVELFVSGGFSHLSLCILDSPHRWHSRAGQRPKRE